MELCRIEWGSSHTQPKHQVINVARRHQIPGLTNDLLFKRARFNLKIHISNRNKLWLQSL